MGINQVMINIIFLFYIGCTTGWIIELIFRRIVHKTWVNPGFLVGPYLPIYGFGVCSLTGIYFLFFQKNLPSILVILLMGLTMTLIEFIGGLSFVNKPVKLWDYSDRWGNYKGIICPLFSFIWTIIAALYYYLIAPYILNLLNWFSHHLLFSFVLGFFSGVFIIDYIYSTQLLSKIKKYAKENKIDVRLEELKEQIKEKQKKSFLFPIKNTLDLKEYIHKYKKIEKKKRRKKHE